MSLLKRYREISSRHSPLGGRAFARSPPNVAPRTRLPISLRFLHSQDTRSVPLQPSTFSTYEASQAPRHCLIIRQHQIPTFAGPPVPTFTRSQVSKLQDSQAARFLDPRGSQAGRLSHYRLLLSLPGPQIQSGRVPGSTESPAGWEAPGASPLTPDPSPV